MPTRNIITTAVMKVEVIVTKVTTATGRGTSKATFGRTVDREHLGANPDEIVMRS
jgi:hypothetical protein